MFELCFEALTEISTRCQHAMALAARANDMATRRECARV